MRRLGKKRNTFYSFITTDLNTKHDKRNIKIEDSTSPSQYNTVYGYGRAYRTLVKITHVDHVTTA